MAPFSLLVAAIIGLQIEIRNLAMEVAKARWEGTSTAAAMEKFERDFFANQRAHEKERIATQSTQDAARASCIDQGLSGLPVGSFRGPVYWNSRTPT